LKKINIFHACRLVKEVVLSLESTRKTNKTTNKEMIFVVIKLRGKRKVKESNQSRRGCTADIKLGAMTELD
jgi:hypothetical protein